MRVSLGERDGNNGVRERCSRIRQWTPIGFEWHEPSAGAAAEERRGVGTNIGRYVPPLERSGETEDSNSVPSSGESVANRASGEGHSSAHAGIEAESG